MNRETIKKIKLILSITDEQAKALKPIIEAEINQARKDERGDVLSKINKVFNSKKEYDVNVLFKFLTDCNKMLQSTEDK